MASQAAPTGHVFISYAREDQTYARKLADHLRARGFGTWMDDRIDFGDRWWQTIVQAVRASAAFIVVMTPDAEQSEWVEKEILLAQRERKPIFPLLLRGQVFPLLITVQYTNVTSGHTPAAPFYEQLAEIAPAKPKVGEIPPKPEPQPKAQVVRPTARKRQPLSEPEIVPKAGEETAQRAGKVPWTAIAWVAGLLKNRVDQVRDRIKQHPLLSLLIIIGIVVIALGNFPDVLFKVTKLIPGLQPPPTNIICPTPIFFQSVVEAHNELGCPIRASTGEIGFQKFEHGIMIWRKHPSSPTIYSLQYDARNWISTPDPGGPPGPSCSEAEENGDRGPIFGFGKLWCAPWNWKSFLGLPVDKGRAAGVNQIVDFEFGTVFCAGEAGGFILHSDSSWESFLLTE